jgi:hypothetical protein
MNERIKALADKAQEYAEWETPQGLEWFDNFKKQFALLIINECAEMGDNFDGQPTGNEVRKYLTAGDAIREHFGVE